MTDLTNQSNSTQDTEERLSMTQVTITPPCPPHQWAHAPTVGYFRCGKCTEQINYDDPRYDAMLAERDALKAKAQQ